MLHEMQTEKVAGKDGPTITTISSGFLSDSMVLAWRLRNKLT
jgi:hypothetical protein